MLKNIALFAAASVLPLAAANAQNTATPPAGTDTGMETPATTASPTEAPADATAPADQAAPATQTAPATDAIVAASAADFSAGATVRDPQGGEVGTVESSTATDAIVSTGTNRVQLPLSSFGKNSGGLVLGLTKAQLDAQAAAATPQTATPQ